MKANFIEPGILERIDSKVVLKGICGIWDDDTKTLVINTTQGSYGWDKDNNRVDEENGKNLDGKEYTFKVDSGVGKFHIFTMENVDLFTLEFEESDNPWPEKDDLIPAIITVEFPSTTKAIIETQHVPKKYLESTGEIIDNSLKFVEIGGEGDSIPFPGRDAWEKYYNRERKERKITDIPRLRGNGKYLRTSGTYKVYSDLRIRCAGSTNFLLNTNREDYPDEVASIFPEFSPEYRVFEIFGVATEKVYRIDDAGEELITTRTINIRNVPGVDIAIDYPTNDEGVSWSWPYVYINTDVSNYSCILHAEIPDTDNISNLLYITYLPLSDFLSGQ